MGEMAFARTIRSTIIMAAALAAAVLTGCSGYHPAPKAFQEATIQPYRLDSGDRLRVTVFEQASLTNTYLVDQAGYIAFPLVGSVPARGKKLDVGRGRGSHFASRSLPSRSGQVRERMQGLVAV